MSSDRLGDWTLDRQLARGATWTRYRARNAGAVAELTVLDEDHADDEAAVRAFQREVAALKQLNHPHVARLLDAGTIDGRPFYALEHLAGPSLAEHLASAGPLGWDALFDLTRQLASALKYAHDRGVWHGDLAPDGIVFVSEPGPGPLPVAKITGFGPAAAVPPPPAERITAYTPPERREGKPAGPRGDVYGLAAVVVALATGRAPQAPNPLAGLPVTLPNEFRLQLERMLDPDPARRPPDGNTLCRQLDKVKASLAEPTLTETETQQATANLVSQYVREELQAQNEGGPVQRFFNHPGVVIPLFLLCAGTLIWTFWPLSVEEQFRRGAELMKSDDPYDWSRAFTDHFEPLEKAHPDHPYQTQLTEFRNRLARSDAERAAARAARWAGPMTEAQWKYQEALRARQQGDEKRARETWQALVDAFGPVESEGPWVRLAKQRLDEEKPDDLVANRKLEPVRAAQTRANILRAQGKGEEADRIERGLKSLYADEAGVLKK